MARGTHPKYLFRNPAVDKPIEDIWADLDGFTDEVFAENTARHEQISMFTLLPPLAYNGRFIKGLLATQASDLLLDRHPYLQDIFHVIAYAMWSGVPRCSRADAVMTTYDNPAREVWYKAQNPSRAGQVWIPHDDTDLFDDQEMAPRSVVKDIDVLCVARLDAIKNLDMFAAAIKVMHAKNPGKKYNVVLNTGEGVSTNWEGLNIFERDELRKLNMVLTNTPDYIHINTARTEHISQLYNRARVVAMTALCEGKNRSIHEAMSCNVPVVTFADFNKYARGDALAFPRGAGLTAPAFTPESLADTLLRALAHPLTFNPREQILQVSGRRTVLTTCLDRIPYYARNLPEFVAGRHLDNSFIDLAMQTLYHRSLAQHLYNFGRKEDKVAFWHKGLDESCRMLERYSHVAAVRSLAAPEC